LVVFLSVPAAVGLIVLRTPIVRLLYDHGSWTPRATDQTALALLFFSLAITSLAAIEVFPRVFYARKDTVTPVQIAVVAVALDAGLGVLFVHTFPRESGVGGLALATAIASGVQALWLAIALERRLGGIGRASLVGAIRDASIASSVMGLVLYVALAPLSAALPQRTLGPLVTVVIEVPLGLAVFVGVGYLLGAPEMWQARDFIRRAK